MSDGGRNWTQEFNRRIAGTMIASHGTRFVAVSAERAILELDFKPELTQMTGLFHAGAIISLADEACTALASVHAMGEGGWDPGKFPLTVQLSANLIRNTGRGTLTAEALPIHKGRTTVVIQSTVKDDKGRLLATVTATQIVPSRQPGQFMNDDRETGGWRRGGPRPAGRSGPPESRPQPEDLRSGERVTESGRPGAAPATGPAPLACGSFANNPG